LRIELSVQTDPHLENRADREHLNELVLATISQEGFDSHATVGLLITSDSRIRRLNLQYRGQDSVTDILAFASGEGSDGFVSPPSAPSHLGDIVVSYPRAVAQAAEYGHPVEEELDRLVIHGVLHLLGYDDQTQEDREAMWRRQEAMVRAFHGNREEDRPSGSA
jgi:probable rRNA maturation factor